MSPEEFARIQEHFLRLRELDVVQRNRLIIVLATSAQKAAEELEIPPLEDPAGSLPMLKNLLANANEDSPLDHPVAQLPGVSSQDLGDAANAAANAADQTTQAIVVSSDGSIPHSIGPYRILQKIGEGGHGLVFMAEQRTPIQRKVAVKLVKPGMESKTILARFEAERQALAMMRHPSIANVIDAGTSKSGSPFFVMELVHGIPIDQFCLENRLEVKELLSLFLQVCDAVHHAHRKGIIHRDIKPANVLVTVDSGKPLAKVIDFGIAKAMHLSLTDKTMFTQYGQIVGTLEYMSPEQALMSQDVADVRSDVYSLGALLYVLLTGSPPISRDQLLQRGIFELPKVMSDVRPPTPSLRLTGDNAAKSWREQTDVEKRSWTNGLRGDLDWITMKALAKELEQRYDSVAALSADIECFLRNEKIQARPPSLLYNARKWIRRHQVAAIATACLLCAAVISFGAVVWGYYQSQENLDEVRTANNLIEEKAEALAESLVEVRTQRKRADASARQMALMLKRELLQSSWAKALSGDGDASRIGLDRIAAADRDYAWHIVDSVRSQLDWPSLRTEASGAVRQLATHDASSTVAVITTESSLEIWDVQSRAKTQQIQLPEAIYSSVAFSDAGKRLLIGASDWVQECDLASGEVGKRLVHGRGGTRDATFDAQRGEWLVTTGANFLLSLDAETMQLKQSIRLPARVSRVSVSPDSKWAAVASLAGAVFLVDLAKFELVATLSHSGAAVNDVRWHAGALIGVDRSGRQTTWTIPMTKQLAETTPSESFQGATFPGVKLPGKNLPDPASLSQQVASQPATIDLAIAGPLSVPPTLYPNGNEDETQQAPTQTLAHSLVHTFAVDRKSQVVLFSSDGDGSPSRIPIRRFAPAVASLNWLPKTGVLLVEHFNGRINLISWEDIECRRNYATQLDGLNDGLCLAKANTSVTAHRDGRLITWNTRSGVPQARRVFGSVEIFSIDAHEGSRRVASYGDDWSIRVADIGTLEEVWTASTSYGVRSVAISHSGRLIAGAPERKSQEFIREGTFDLWDMQSGSSQVQCVGHENWVLQFVWDSSDTNLYSLSVDGTIRRWDAKTGRSTLQIDFADESPVSVIGLLEESNQLVCGHQDGSLSLRSLRDGSLVASQPMLTNSVGGLIVFADERFAIACTDSESSLTCIDTRGLRVVAEWDPQVGAIKGIRSDQSKSRLQILGEGVARILDLPPILEATK
ncbi:MAG: hypothetical protein Aurels2KO_00090 [Aureliella sp.]